MLSLSLWSCHKDGLFLNFSIVQLRRTDTQKVPKPYQMPARSLSMQCLSSTTDTYLKTDLIAELKISKDIPGIKKMKVEKQMANRFDSEHYSEITKQFTASNYVDQVSAEDFSLLPLTDSS